MQIEFKEDLWKPDVLILNNDTLNVVKSTIEFFPQTGLARNILTLEGSIANDMSLRYFPVSPCTCVKKPIGGDSNSNGSRCVSGDLAYARA